MSDYVITSIKCLIETYTEKLEECDEHERLIYCGFINDLKELLSDLAHY